MDVNDMEILHLESLTPDVVREIIRIIRSNGAIPALYTTDLLNQNVYYDTLEGACRFFAWYVTEDRRCERIDDVVQYADDARYIRQAAGRQL